MGATKVGQQGDATSGIIATVRAGMQEIEQRWVQPFRQNLWKYVLPVRTTPCTETPHAAHEPQGQCLVHVLTSNKQLKALLTY